MRLLVTSAMGPPLVSDSPTRGPIPMFLRRPLAGIPLRALSGADAAVSTFIGDVAPGLLAACRAPALHHEVYHLGSGAHPASYREPPPANGLHRRS